MEYNRILYVYIDQYKGAKDVEVRLDDRYEIHFDKTSNKLSIKESKNHIDGFWGNKIYSLAAIVGENGAGKSTTIKYVLEAVASGYHKEMDNNIIVMGKGEKIIICTCRKMLCEGSVAYEFADFLSVPVFYYSAHFEPPFNGGEITSSQFGEDYYNASDSYRIVRDYQDYCNYGTKNYNLTLYDHLFGHYVQNTFRICTLLGDHYDEMLNFGIIPPRYLQINPNTSGLAFLHSDPRTTDIDVQHFPELNWTEPKCIALAVFMYNIIINIVVDVFRFTNRYDSGVNKFSDDINNAVDKWINILKTNIFSETHLLIDEFCNYLENSDYKEIFPINAKDMLSMILHCDFTERGSNGIFYFDMGKNTVNVKNYLNEIKRKGSHFYIARFYDMVYSHTLDNETILSSGEQAMLNLYSHLYHALMIKKTDFNNIAGPQLIVLDEAEIGYHPEWQRRFIKNVTRFLDSLGTPDGFFQVVVTTHSPLILSDIPLTYTSYLTKEDKPRPTQETFGANIFDLYHNSFFLKEGMIGEFAMEKIENVASLIDDWKEQGANVESDEIKRTKQIINLIANDRLKDYLIDELSAIDKEGAIEYYQQKIHNLKQG